MLRLKDYLEPIMLQCINETGILNLILIEILNALKVGN